MNEQHPDGNVGLFGVGAILAIMGNALDSPPFLLIGAVLAVIGFFRVIWYS